LLGAPRGARPGRRHPGTAAHRALGADRPRPAPPGAGPRRGPRGLLSHRRTLRLPLRGDHAGRHFRRRPPRRLPRRASARPAGDGPGTTCAGARDGGRAVDARPHGGRAMDAAAANSEAPRPPHAPPWGMAWDDWYLTRDIDDFLARAGDFLRAEPAAHTVHLTVTETLRTRGARSYGDEPPEFGVLEQDQKVRAAFFRTPPHRLCPTPLTPAEADALAGLLHDRGQPLPGVQGDQDTAAAFADAWRRRTGAEVTLHERQRLYRLGELTVPQPVPPGRARTAGPE